MKIQTKYSIPCVIFAGGKSSRMGSDKALLPFGSYDTLCEFQYKRLKELFTNVYISTKEKEKFPFEAEFIEDTSDVFAPSAGFVSVFSSLHVKEIFVLSVDTPFVGKNEIDVLLSFTSQDYDAVIAKSPQGSHPLCGLYASSLLNKFQEMLQTDNHRMGALLKSSNTRYVEFEDDTPFLNLNDPKEYEKALLILKQNTPS